MSNDPKLVDILNSASRKAELAIRDSATGRPNPQGQQDTINQLVKVILQLDARIVALEENLKNQG
ncbi:hypothetical protein [Pseudomonas mohnii]